MRIIGLTGGIASGKSTVSRILRELGAPIIDADEIVHQVQQPGTPVMAAIAREFGPEVIRSDGGLDRQRLGKIIFADAARRKVLEALIHPVVLERMAAEVERYRQEGRPAVVLDVPLLIEGGIYRRVDQVWLVYVDPETERARLMARDNLTAEEAAQRIGAQMDLEAKRAYAQVIIDNRGALEETRAQVIAAWEAAIRS